MEICCCVTEDKAETEPKAEENELVPKIRSGSFADIGPRRSMEDEHLRMDDLSMELDLRCPKPSACYVIFDGHGGSEASTYLKQNATRLIFKDSNFPNSTEVTEPFLQSVENSLHKAFILADTALCESASISPWSGTTALAALIFGSVLLVANAGDCRAVLCRKGQAIDMSKDHKGVCPLEQRRVEAMGGFVENGYLNGVLAVTRALGDWEMKMKLPSPLIPDPEIKRIELTREDEFLVVACDGIWDVMSSQDAVEIVRSGIRRCKDEDECAREVAMEALRRESFDNLTVIVVCLTNRDRIKEVIPPQQPQPRWRPRFRCSEVMFNPTK